MTGVSAQSLHDTGTVTITRLRSLEDPVARNTVLVDAHEVVNVVNSIHLQAQLMCRRLEAEGACPRAREASKAILSESTRLLGLLRPTGASS